MLKLSLSAQFIYKISLEMPNTLGINYDPLKTDITLYYINTELTQS